MWAQASARFAPRKTCVSGRPTCPGGAPQFTMNGCVLWLQASPSRASWERAPPSADWATIRPSIARAKPATPASIRDRILPGPRRGPSPTRKGTTKGSQATPDAATTVRPRPEAASTMRPTTPTAEAAGPPAPRARRAWEACAPAGPRATRESSIALTAVARSRSETGSRVRSEAATARRPLARAPADASARTTPSA
jgi:hypothetical protein